ncbi:hypothetical protein SUGI_0094660 [Cryptomeria japonica]|nr:hypothetical protein SUGI_0094650 [Cryptomeria japonica]GLJ08728.1 hypothetical protein SUGI_0094660 [Cryptomeria japonica]
MGKGIYHVFLLFLLLTPPLALVSGKCSRNYSASFHGGCWVWREGECDSVCKNVEHQDHGQCEDCGFATNCCFCYGTCDK